MTTRRIGSFGIVVAAAAAAIVLAEESGSQPSTRLPLSPPPTANTPSTPRVAASLCMDPLWIEKLKELLCRLYREWGGDCANLPFDSDDSMSALNASMVQLADFLSGIGVPSGWTTPQRQQALSDLQELDALLSETPPEGIDSGAVAYLLAEVRSLENTLGGDGRPAPRARRAWSPG